MFADIKAAVIKMITDSNLVKPDWVYNYEPPQPGGFPSIAVTAFTGDGVFADTQRNRRNYVIRIRCYMERQTVGSQQGVSPQEESERIMTALVDSLISLFDNQARDANNNGAFNLNGLVPNLVFVQPVPQEWSYAQAPNVEMRLADIKLNAVVVQ